MHYIFITSDITFYNHLMVMGKIIIIQSHMNG